MIVLFLRFDSLFTYLSDGNHVVLDHIRYGRSARSGCNALCKNRLSVFSISCLYTSKHHGSELAQKQPS